MDSKESTTARRGTSDRPMLEGVITPALTARAKKQVEKFYGACRQTVEEAWELGNILKEAKAALSHGAWLPWLEEIGLPERGAQRCIQLATGYSEKRHVSDLRTQKAALDGLRSALPSGRKAKDSSAQSESVEASTGAPGPDSDAADPDVDSMEPSSAAAADPGDDARGDLRRCLPELRRVVERFASDGGRQMPKPFAAACRLIVTLADAMEVSLNASLDTTVLIYRLPKWLVSELDSQPASELGPDPSALGSDSHAESERKFRV